MDDSSTKEGIKKEEKQIVDALSEEEMNMQIPFHLALGCAVETFRKSLSHLIDVFVSFLLFLFKQLPLPYPCFMFPLNSHMFCLFVY